MTSKCCHLALAQACPEKLYRDDEVIVRQDEAGSSMFVIVSGRVRVVLQPSGGDVATIDAGGFFGEMSMLTGEPRTASVHAMGDVAAIEITAEHFRHLALDRPDLVEHVTSVLAARRTGMQDARAAAAATVVPAASRHTLFERIERFLRLPSR